MQLKTERLNIRQLGPEDWKSMRWIAADFAKSPYAVYDMPFPTEEREIKALTKKFADSHLFFAVLLADTMIGYVCFHNENERYDLGYCFHSDYHGNGYAFESCFALLSYMNRERGAKAFTAGTALQNDPSCRLLAKLGFTLAETETLSFCKDENGADITFEGGIFYKNITAE